MSLLPLYDHHLQILRQRTDAAMHASGVESLAIYAGRPPMQFLDDLAYPFKVNPHFKAWAPVLDAPDCWIAYEPAKKPRLVFLQPNDYWHKAPAVPNDYWTAHFGIEIIREPAEARQFLAQLPHCAFIGEMQPEFADWGFEATNPPELMERLHYTRAIKTPYEIQCIRVASDLGVRGHRAAEAAFRAGASEYAIQMAYVQATGLTETALPYSNIVALNTNASILHYQHQETAPPSQRRSFLIDAGAHFAGYASDITRTYSNAHDEFEALVEGMHRLQLELCSQVRAGVDYADIHLSAHKHIAELLRTSGVITMAADDAVASGLSGVFYPHGVGHLLGLQVHDVSGFSVTPEGKRKARPAGHPNLRLTRTLEPGFVVTIEPGLYFIDSLLAAARESGHAAHIDWRQVERFRPFGGIRIEDNVACTTGAPENLTREAFAKLAAD